MPDQVDNLLQDQVFLRGEPDRRPDNKCNKVADVPVNPIPPARSDMITHNLQSSIFRHISSGCPENVIQDHSQVDDVTHQALNIFLAGMRKTEPVVNAFKFGSTHLP